MVDIVKVFNSVLSHNRSIDVAESEFKRMLYDDKELRKAYKDWCSEFGHYEKTGFVEYCSEAFDEEELKWDSLINDYE